MKCDRQAHRMVLAAAFAVAAIATLDGALAQATTNLPPTCSITATTAVTAPAGTLRGFSFTGTGRDPENGPLQVEWTFGGGADAHIEQTFTGSFTTSTGPIGFDLNGVFNVLLAVTDNKGARCQATVSVTVPPLVTGLPPKVPEQAASGVAAAGNSAYRVLPFNNLGMHCADSSSLPFSILPPFNVLNAQLVKKGSVGTAKPVIVSPSTAAVELHYSAASNAVDPAAAGSINSTSRNFPVGSTFLNGTIKKTDFWDVVKDPATGVNASIAAILFPGLNPRPDEGLQTNLNFDHGRFMPGIDGPYALNTPELFSTFETANKWFTAQGVPITPVDDSGHVNAYPLMRVQAILRPSTVLATTDAVVPVSTEVDCRDCHSLGGPGANAAARPHGPVFVAAATSSRYDKERAAKINIVRLHDFKHGTKLEAEAPVLCASCHRSNALVEVGGPAGSPLRQPMSTVVHGFHGKLVVNTTGTLVRDLTGEPVLSVTPPTGERPLIPTTGSMDQNCFLCHPGKITQCFRDVMKTAGQVCTDCHGTMLSVSGQFPLLVANRTRVAWQDEPRCESCHQGAPTVQRLAYAAPDRSATPIIPTNRVFGEETGKLYRNSHGHGGIACEGCHGSPHAIWPVANPNANDNVTAKQLQGHSGKIAECTVCHTAGAFGRGTLGGPHGMHPVNDPGWMSENGHPGFRRAANGTDACASCHGANHLGTRLSKAQADRSFRVESRTVSVKQGDIIGCGLCHSVSESFGD